VTAVSYALMVAIAVLLLSAALIVLQGGIKSAFRGGGTCVAQPRSAGCVPDPGSGGGGDPPGSTSPSSSTTTTTTTLP